MRGKREVYIDKVPYRVSCKVYKVKALVNDPSYLGYPAPVRTLLYLAGQGEHSPEQDCIFPIPRTLNTNFKYKTDKIQSYE